MKRFFQILFLVLLVAGTIFIIRQQQAMPYQHDSGEVFGTFYKVTYQSDKNLKSEIEAALKGVDYEFSMYNENSTVSKINRGETPELSEMFMEVYNLSQTVNKESEGAFDITVAPLVNAWGFGFKTRQMPDKRQVDSLLAFVGNDKFKVMNEGKKFIPKKRDKRTMLDFSAIAKGYGSDVVARLLRKNDVKNFMVEIGGEVVTSGNSEKRLPWKIGVTKPVDDSLSVDNELQTVLNLTDKALATSGNYRKFYYKDGKKYAHTIDPKTGRPVQHNILSATVITKDCATADAYATAFMVLGMEGTKRVLEKHPELMVYLIYSDDKGKNSVWFSPSLEGKITN
ncbi:MAG: FAD:protein FMN transferase [Prevotella sp.]|uniref:FAD:protein FMN transferase n=1 Tax=Prevotella sp. TaxID=59823 RepID=UPI002A348347|nr:FAD:protein FMN transferase [Prevotella sp.]MDD7318738.1 FAD:protein FMN transferase [Prevotellaceae bacterium]MDY4019306.1 FAD:protein FMN transferase [Prevotella sp.]